MSYEPQKVYENKRVVLITGAQSKWYEQAIFIVRKNGGANGVDVVAEAERIIEAYLSKGKPAAVITKTEKPRARKQSKRGFMLAVNLITLISLCAVFAMLAYRYFA